MTAAEARALFLVAGPASAATPAVKAGLRKLLRALPETMRDDAESASSALVVDPTRWGQKTHERPPPGWLDALQTAVITGEQVRLGYVSSTGETTIRVVHPLGIAAKGIRWYLVADTDAGMRTFRIDRVTTADGTGAPVVRPTDFDLASAWKLIVERAEDRWSPSVRARTDPDTVRPLRWAFGTRLRVGPTTDDGRVEVEIGAPDHWALLATLAAFGSHVEVMEPPEFRVELARIGADLVAMYGPRSSRSASTASPTKATTDESSTDGSTPPLSWPPL